MLNLNVLMSNVVTTPSDLVLSKSSWGSKQALNELGYNNLVKANTNSVEVLESLAIEVAMEGFDEVVYHYLIVELLHQCKNTLTPCFSKEVGEALLKKVWGEAIQDPSVQGNNKAIIKSVIIEVQKGLKDNNGRKIFLTDVLSVIFNTLIKEVIA